MKRLIFAALLPLLLTGCIPSSTNMVTTNYDKEGRVVSVVREGSDQDSWFGAISEAERQKTARVRMVMGDNEQHPATTHPTSTSGDCSYALTEMGRAMRSMSVAFMEREHAVVPEPRGFWRSVDNTVDKVGLPLSIAVPMERMGKHAASNAGDVNLSDNAQYTRNENPVTGQGNTTMAPNGPYSPTTTSESYNGTVPQ